MGGLADKSNSSIIKPYFASAVLLSAWIGFINLGLALPVNCSASPESDESTRIYPPLPFATEFGGVFKLTTHEGRVVTQKDFHGKYAILYFGYTECADTCPTALLAISTALQQLGSFGERITPLFVNLDAKRMSLKNLKQYVRYFHPRFVGLTGTAIQIKKAAAGYEVRYRIVTRKDGTRSIVHSGKIFFLGPDGKVIAYYPHEAPSKWLVTSIRIHMNKGIDGSSNPR